MANEILDIMTRGLITMPRYDKKYDTKKLETNANGQKKNDSTKSV